MADVHPFRAFRYDPRQVTPARVVTQPYDKITPALQDHYYEASPHNLVRVILGRRKENDNAANNVYSRAASARHPEPGFGRLCLYLFAALHAARFFARLRQRTGTPGVYRPGPHRGLLR